MDGIALRAVIFLFLAMLSNVVVPSAQAAPTAVAEKSDKKGGIETVVIQPHRAIYAMSLGSVKNGSAVNDVSGTMLFEWADACDGWAVQQNLQLHFSHAEGDQSDLASNEVSWERKDGKRYNFFVRHVTDGKETENYRGKADLTGDKPAAIYSKPDGKTIALQPDTFFPSMHTRLIISKALEGDRFFTRQVFDGSDENGMDDVSVFIGPSRAEAITAGMDPKLSSNPLMSHSAWPIHMAFFKLDDETGEPDYEMDMVLQANGVVRSMRIDYGDFSVIGTLKAIESLPAQHC